MSGLGLGPEKKELPKLSYLFADLQHQALPARFSHSKLLLHQKTAVLRFFLYMAVSIAMDVGVYFVFVYVTPDLEEYAWLQTTIFYALLASTGITVALFNQSRQHFEMNFAIAHIHCLSDPIHPVQSLTFWQAMGAAIPFDQDMNPIPGERPYTKSFPQALEAIVRIFATQRVLYFGRSLVYYFFVSFDFFGSTQLLSAIFIALTGVFSLMSGLSVALNFLRPSSAVYSALRRRRQPQKGRGS